jgi:hypothetical protein
VEAVDADYLLADWAYEIDVILGVCVRQGVEVVIRAKRHRKPVRKYYEHSRSPKAFGR